MVFCFLQPSGCPFPWQQTCPCESRSSSPLAAASPLLSEVLCVTKMQPLEPHPHLAAGWKISGRMCWLVKHQEQGQRDRAQGEKREQGVRIRSKKWARVHWSAEAKEQDILNSRKVFLHSQLAITFQKTLIQVLLQQLSLQ